MSTNIHAFRKVKIVVVEDDTDDLYTVKRLLSGNTKLRFEIFHADSLASLKELSVGLQPDLVLLDLNLVDSEGMDTLVIVMDIVPDTPVIVLTGLEEDDFGSQAINFGAQDFLPKAEFTHFNLQRSICYALERYHLVKALSEKALKDPLTLLPNRMVFEETLTSWIEEAKREGYALAIMMLDLNRFKDINDAFGHLCGDKVLKQIGSRLNSQSRRNDLIARIGGDEFAAIFRDVPSDQDLKIIAQQKIDLIEQDCLLVHNGEVTPVQVGVSVGISRLTAVHNTAEKLLEHADKLMYKIKNSSGGKSGFSLIEQSFKAG